MDDNWHKIKKDYWTGTVVFAFCVVLSFFTAPAYRLSDLTKKTVKIAGYPVWKETHSKGSNYWVNLYFFNDPGEYEISGIDYKYLNYAAFKDSIHYGDIVTVGVKGDQILTFEKNGLPYLNFDKAQFHKRQNRIWASVLFFTGFICCIIPLFFKTYPTIRIRGYEIQIRFGFVLMTSLIIAFCILYSTIGYEFVSGERFAN